MPNLRTSVSFALLLLGVSQRAIAQTGAPPAPTKSWNADFAATVGVVPPIGATTSVDLSGAATLVRTTSSGIFDHRCRGVTTMVTWTRHETSILAGPRFDTGDDDGTAFLRVLAGVRRLSGEGGGSTLGVGVGAGVAVGGVLLDINGVMSPWAERVPYRLSVSIGYVWSVPFTGGS